MFKQTFSSILAATALISQESVAISSQGMNDPLSLSQTSAYGGVTAHSILQNSLGQVQPVQQTILAQTKDVVAEAVVTDDSAVRKEKCVKDVTTTFFAGKGVTTPPLDQFNNFVNTICPTLDMRIPNGIITASCFHTGYFLLKTLRPFADAGIVEGGEVSLTNFDIHVDDFCSNYVAEIPERNAFVKAIYAIENAEAFNTACTNHLLEHVTLNTWFDPIDPLSSITQREICDLHFKLFTSLRAKQRSSLAEYVSFSYLASLDLFLNAQQQEDFENCVNQEVVAHSSSWVTEFSSSHAAFKNWDSAQMVNESANAAQAVTDGCADQLTCTATSSCKTCDGCSIAISRIYKKYEEYLNNLFAETFKAHSEAMFNKLHEANLALETVV